MFLRACVSSHPWCQLADLLETLAVVIVYATHLWLKAGWAMASRTPLEAYPRVLLLSVPSLKVLSFLPGPITSVESPPCAAKAWPAVLLGFAETLKTIITTNRQRIDCTREDASHEAGQ